LITIFFLLGLFSSLTAVSVREFATGSRRSSSVRVSKRLQFGRDALMFELGNVRYITNGNNGMQCSRIVLFYIKPLMLRGGNTSTKGAGGLLGGAGTVRHSDSMQRRKATSSNEPKPVLAWRQTIT